MLNFLSKLLLPSPGKLRFTFSTEHSHKEIRKAVLYKKFIVTEIMSIGDKFELTFETIEN